MKKVVHILQLYPHDMNIYGDFGNLLVLKRRLEWYGYKPVIVHYNIGDKFPSQVDIILGGGGQDSGQNKIQNDLLTISSHLHALANNGTPMLMICGLYQLFGKFFKTADGEVIKGIGILDIETYGKSERLIGNIVTHSQDFGDIVGYENHSGQTFLKDQTQSFGQVKFGVGNNIVDDTEGARYKNVIGSYLHGSLLPKNPKVADFLIKTAVQKRYGQFAPKQLIDDLISNLARQTAIKRPR